MDEQNAPDRARLTAALLLWHLGELDEAKMHATRLLQMQPQYVPALTLMGWLELQAADPIPIPHPSLTLTLTPTLTSTPTPTLTPTLTLARNPSPYPDPSPSHQPQAPTPKPKA